MSGIARAQHVAAKQPNVAVVVGIDLCPLADAAFKIVVEGDWSVSHRVGIAKARPRNVGTVPGDVGGDEVVGIRTQFQSSEAHRVAPETGPCRATEIAHVGIVRGLGGETCELNSSAVHKIVLESGEVGGCAVLVFPLVTIGGTGPTELRTIGFDIGDGEV